MSLKNWSTTAGSNATVDSINFAENQAPSTVNDSARALMADVRTWYNDLEWRDWGHTVTYASATSFTIATDLTAIYTANRPIRCTDATTLYGRVVSSSYGAPNTTVNVILETGSLSASLTAVSLGFKIRTMSVSNGVSSQSGTASYATNIAFTDATATRTVTVPDESGTVVLKDSSTGIASFSSGIGPSYLQNIGLTASVATKALTIALKTKALADPSAGSPVELSFRNRTLTTGDYVIRQVTAAASIVVPSGATLGFTTAEAGYVYIYVCDDGSAREVGVSKKALFNEASLHTTTAITTGADSDNILYTTNALTTAAVRLVGKLNITTGAVAGEWDNAPTQVSIWTPDKAVYPLRIATASGSGAAYVVAANFDPDPNVEVGDTVILNISVSGVKNAANNFLEELTLGETGAGTCVLQYNPSGFCVLTFGSLASHASGGTVYASGTYMFKVITAGTLAGVGCSAVTELGTAPTTKAAYVYAEVWRGWNA